MQMGNSFACEFFGSIACVVEYLNTVSTSGIHVSNETFFFQAYNH